MFKLVIFGFIKNIINIYVFIVIKIIFIKVRLNEIEIICLMGYVIIENNLI